MSASLPLTSEQRRRMAADSEARKGRTGPWTRADKRRVEKILRKVVTRTKSGGRVTINLDRREKRAAQRKFGVSGKRYRELTGRARRGAA